MDDKEKKVSSLSETEEQNELVLTLRKPYTFEGQTYTELDLSGLEAVTAGMLERVSKTVLQQAPGLNPGLLEMSMPYCMELAARVLGQPREFFHSLPAGDAIGLKSLITNFLYGGDVEE